MTNLPSLSQEAQSLKIGYYKHYKGNRYQVIAKARCSETLDELVVYQDVSDPEKIWVRPLKMFCETVTLENGKVSPRFYFVSE